MLKWIFAAMQTIAGRRKGKEVKPASRRRCEACAQELPILPRMLGLDLPLSIDRPQGSRRCRQFRYGLRVERWKPGTEILIGFILNAEDCIVWLN